MIKSVLCGGITMLYVRWFSGRAVNFIIFLSLVPNGLMSLVL